MKLLKKVTFLVAMMLLCIGTTSMYVSAASESKDGVEVTLTTDKDSYSKGSEIKTNITIKNTNSFDISNVSLETSIPDGLEIKETSDSKTTIGILKAGEEYNCELVLQESTKSSTSGSDDKEDSEDDNKDQPSKDEDTTTESQPSNNEEATTEKQSSKTEATTANKHSEKTEAAKGTDAKNEKKASGSGAAKTGDLSSPLKLLAGLVVSAIIIMLLLFMKKNKIFMLFLGVIGTAFLLGNGTVTCKADTNIKQGEVSVSKIVQVDNKEYKLGAKVSYEYQDDQGKEDEEDTEKIKLTIDQKDFTTEKKNVSLTGTYSGDIEKIVYKNIPGDKSYGEISSGSVSFDQNKWSFELKDLATGENNVTITATDSNNNETQVSIQIILEGLYEYSQDDIVTDKATGAKYINNIVLVFFEKGISDNEKKEIIEDVSGKIVGSEKDINQLQIRIPDTSYSGIKKIIKKLESKKGVICATVDAVSKITADTDEYDTETRYPADGVTNYEELATWYQSMGVQYLPIYEKTKIDIGIIDNGFDFSHEDLELINVSDFSIENDPYTHDHGTHVAGIIGAKDNGIGMTGVTQNHNIYCYNYWTKSKENASEDEIEEIDSIASSRSLNGLIRVINKGAKVVNMSFGIGDEPDDEEKNNQGKQWSAYIYSIIDNGDDFLLVESAGNTSIDTTRDAFLAMIDESNCVTSDTISKEDILDKIVIVGSAKEISAGNYQLSHFSCGGDKVDITALGEGIFSTIVDAYGYGDGTSMAAPMVAGTLAGIWEINPSMSSSEVREIVLNSASNIVKTNPASPNAADSGRTTYPLLNIKNAVEQMKGTFSGTILQEDRKTPIENVEVQVYSKDKFVEGYKSKANGTFEIKLLEGEYELRFIKPDYQTSRVTINVKNNTKIEFKNPIIMKNAGIQGSVVNENGNAISGVNVEIKNSNTDEKVDSTTTNENGQFSLKLENGEYKVVFTKEGYETATEDKIIVFNDISKIKEITMKKESQETEEPEKPAFDLRGKTFSGTYSGRSCSLRFYEYTRYGGYDTCLEYNDGGDISYIYFNYDNSWNSDSNVLIMNASFVQGYLRDMTPLRINAQWNGETLEFKITLINGANVCNGNFSLTASE